MVAVKMCLTEPYRDLVLRVFHNAGSARVSVILSDTQYKSCDLLDISRD